MLARLAAMRQVGGVDVNGIFKGVSQQQVAVEGEVVDALTSGARLVQRVSGRRPPVVHAGLASCAGRMGQKQVAERDVGKRGRTGLAPGGGPDQCLADR